MMFRQGVALLVLGRTVLAADCLQNQQRQGNEPSGEQIAKALTANSALDSICSGNWRTGDTEKLSNTFNHWSMLYSVQRTDNTKPLAYCKDAFTNIIEQCITNGNYWGGVWSLNGETYNISNSAYPSNGLGPQDDGGPPDPTTTKPVDTGPVTVGPQTSTESGTFQTKTSSIAGLTTNSVTTTSANGHPTVLPIWFVSAGVGILLIPGADVVAGGIIPPPPGFPPLIIGSDGQAHTPDDNNDHQTKSDPSKTSPTSTTSSTSSCTSCSTCVGFDILPADPTPGVGDGDLKFPPIDTSPWTASVSTAAPPPPTSKPATPTQSAVPIDQPACVDASGSVRDDLPNWTTKGRAIQLPDRSNPDVNALLYMLRESVCGGSCTAPPAIPSKYVAIYQKGGACEVSVALSAKIELFVNRDTWPEDNADFNEIWQQCWDSTENLINKCVQNGPKAGWWNGNHVYQFYAAGLRDLNAPDSHHVQNGIMLGEYLEPPTDGLSCGKDCVGYIPNPQWCNDHCRASRRSERWGSTILHKRVDGIDVCKLPYTFPPYPSAGDAERVQAIVSHGYYDRDNTPNCDNPKLNTFSAKVPASAYNTEHVFEKQMVTRFFYYLIGGEQMLGDDGSDPGTPPPANQCEDHPIASCQVLQAVFGTKNAAGTHFRDQTAAQQIANAVSCGGGSCPDQGGRLSEFFLLNNKLNGFKAIVFAGYYKKSTDDNNKLPRCADTNDIQDMQQQMVRAALVFQYLNRQEVFNAFKAVHDRISGILTNLDADAALGQAVPPPNLACYIAPGSPNTWLGAYQEFVNRFLERLEFKMGRWQHECKQSYLNKAVNDADKKKVSSYDSGNGVYASSAVELNSLWDAVK
ncbi:uncharacterized protein E0L32_002901 [Thyridium curvatum]|uniref:Uncharacterized protein n=1 Tax=Thyridium curvatum TaxID=1093900 RepID=A0A507BM56_9PEZI|nr:uncharacterized protein E0L32_002901 [Thyridium curvatum]TPX17800.1 hypothetical protein E0L32_002901 [Thyridium curvatum]